MLHPILHSLLVRNYYPNWLILHDLYVLSKCSFVYFLCVEAMTLSPASSRSAAVGEIVNLMSVDVQKCQDVCYFVNYLWSSPLIIAVTVYFLWQILGPSTLAGVIFMLVILPLMSVFLAKKIKDVQVSP